MCTSIIHNGKKTIIGWNLDILNLEYKVVAEKTNVYIAINDNIEGWMPLFGANNRGDFVAMPTCWPFDTRSNPIDKNQVNIIELNIDLLLQKKSFFHIKKTVENSIVCSVPGVTFQSQLSDKNGNVLQVIPGQGTKFYSRPKFSVLTNFSPFKGDSVRHPWMGIDRYKTAVSMLSEAKINFDVSDCFEVLKSTSQTVCPTVVSMVFDVSENTVYWCENRDYENIRNMQMETVLNLI